MPLINDSGYKKGSKSAMKMHTCSKHQHIEIRYRYKSNSTNLANGLTKAVEVVVYQTCEKKKKKLSFAKTPSFTGKEIRDCNLT